MKGVCIGSDLRVPGPKNGGLLAHKAALPERLKRGRFVAIPGHVRDAQIDGTFGVSRKRNRRRRWDGTIVASLWRASNRRTQLFGIQKHAGSLRSLKADTRHVRTRRKAPAPSD